MRITTRNLLFSVLGLGLVCGSADLWPSPVRAQVPYPFATPTTPDAQRNALNGVRSQVRWLQNSTRTAPSYPSAGYDKVWERFLMLRGAYGAFKNTPMPRQLEYGAKEIAELDAGLHIPEEAFGGYQEEVAARVGFASFAEPVPGTGPGSGRLAGGIEQRQRAVARGVVVRETCPGAAPDTTARFRKTTNTLKHSTNNFRTTDLDAPAYPADKPANYPDANESLAPAASSVRNGRQGMPTLLGEFRY